MNRRRPFPLDKPPAAPSVGEPSGACLDRRIGNAVQARDVPNAVRGTVGRKPLAIPAGKVSGRGEPESEDWPEGMAPAARTVAGAGPSKGTPMADTTCAAAAHHAYDTADRRALYRTIFERRDTRRDFLPDPIAPEVLSRVLLAAHHAPSVGFMQPWDFILLRDPAVRARVHALFARANAELEELTGLDVKGKWYKTL